MHHSASTRRSLAGSFIASLAVLFSFSVGHASAETKTILGRLYDTYLVEQSAAHSDTYLSSQLADGTWTDIKYTEVSAAPFAHMNRLQAMAVAYRSVKSPHHQDPKMLAGITKGLDIWFKKKPVSSNWWDNQIGQQLNMMAILVLVNDKLPKSTFNAGIGLLNATVPPGANGKAHDAQNLLWFAEQQLVRGLLLDSNEGIRKAVGLIEGELQPNVTLGKPFSDKIRQWTTGKGVQADFSYHMHGPLLYNGGYGMGVLGASRFALALQGTQFAFKPESIEAMAQYALQGSGMMVRGKMIDPGSIGRNISRPGNMGLATKVARLSLDVAKLSPKNASALTELAKHINGQGKPYSFIGHKHFWNSDFTVHQRASYYTSVRMFSSRTNGTESINGENLLGYWLPYGFNVISRDGSEYGSLPPIWDWVHLPGVTAPHKLPKVSGITQPDNFVGGVTEKMYGVSGMRFETPATAEVHLKAHKAWFFFDKEYVALGAGITSNDSVNIDTTLNQTSLRGDVLVNGSKSSAGAQEYPNVRWVHHDGVGYVFPRATKATIRTGAHTGSWSKINSGKSANTVTENVMTLWVSHGKKPQNASYEYIVVPGIDASDVARYSSTVPVRVLSNTTSLQAVQHSELGITQAVFYRPGNLDLGDGTTLSIDQPAFVMVKDNGLSSYDVIVSSPVALQVKVRLTTSFGFSDVKYSLSDGVKTGTSYGKRFSVKIPKGFFKIGSSRRVYQSDGQGNICWYLEVNQLQMNGGFNGEAIVNYPNTPRVAGTDEWQSCALNAGFFNLGGKTIYRSFGNGTYCQFMSKDVFVKAGGANDFSNVYQLTQIPSTMTPVGACK